MTSNGRFDDGQRDESVFVAVEIGGAWPRRLDACGHGHAATAVVAQEPDESSACFARRCAVALEALDPAHHALTQAVIVVGRRLDAETGVARSAVARALLRRMSAGPEGVLCFAAPGEFPDENRHELMALIQSLMELASTRLGIRFVPADPNGPADATARPERREVVEVQAW